MVVGRSVLSESARNTKEFQTRCDTENEKEHNMSHHVMRSRGHSNDSKLKKRGYGRVAVLQDHWRDSE